MSNIIFLSYTTVDVPVDVSKNMEILELVKFWGMSLFRKGTGSLKNYF